MMGRTGFAGGGDYSSLFASLYQAGINKAENAAEKAKYEAEKAETKLKNEAIKQQNADDQEASDAWSNGTMTDSDWLEYISQRIGKADDPQDRQQWQGYLDKYGPAIADSQAEQAYEQGGSIDDLVKHYEGRLGTLTPNSEGFRDVQDKLAAAIDQRASGNLTTGAEGIIANIEKGKATYDDLLKFLQAGKAQARPNSSLYASLEKQIGQVKETIATNKLEGRFAEVQYNYETGKINEGTYAKWIKSQAPQFKESDPQRYYKLLGAANDLEEAAKKKVEAGKGSSGGSSGGSGGSSGGSGKPKSSAGGKPLTPTQAANARVDAAQAERNNLQAQIQQYENNPAAPVIDPATGKAKVLSPEAVKAIDAKLMKVWDEISAAYLSKPKPDKSAAANAQKSKAAYISTNVVTHNTMTAADQSQHLLSSVNSMLDDALDDADPTHGMGKVQMAAKMVNAWATKLTTTPPKGKMDGYGHYSETPGTAKGPMDLVDPALVTRAKTLGQALSVLADENVDEATAAAALQTIRDLDGSAPGGTQEGVLTGLAKKVIQVNGTKQGLASGEIERVVTSEGIKYAPTVKVSVPVYVDGQARNIERRQVDASDFITDKKTQGAIDVFIDINGEPTKVKAIASETSLAGASGWFAKSDIKLKDGTVIRKDTPVPASVLDKFGEEIGAKLELRPAIEFNQVVIPSYTDSNGTHQEETWSQDPSTQLWYKGSLPIRNIQFNADGSVKFSDDGSVAMDYRAFAHQAGVPSPYSGSNAKSMQDIANQGIAGKPSGGRDITGRYNPELTYDGSQAYYDPNAYFPSGISMRESWWDDEAQAGKAQSEADKFKAKVAAERSAARKRNEEAIKDALGDNDQVTRMLEKTPLPGLLKAFGIDIMPAKPKAPAKVVGQGARPTGIQIVEPSGDTPVVNAATGFNLSLPTATSGPKVSAAVSVKLPAGGKKAGVATAPKVTTPKATPPKVTTPKATPPKVTTPKATPAPTKVANKWIAS